MIITDDKYIAEKARHLATTAKISHEWEFEHDSIGWNDRMPNINAALGCAQLKDLNKKIMKKRGLNKKYQSKINIKCSRQWMKRAN